MRGCAELDGIGGTTQQTDHAQGLEVSAAQNETSDAHPRCGSRGRRGPFGTRHAPESLRVVLIQLLLPSAPTSEAAAFSVTHGELVDRFQGLTAYVRSPAKGVWTAPDGAVERDDVIMVEVVSETFDREWWRVYAEVLARRFGQDEIHVRAMQIEVLGPHDG
jgi:hypothetical protein